MRSPRDLSRAPIALVLLALAAGTASAKGGAHTGPKSRPTAAKPPEWSEEAGTFTLQVFDPPLRAYVQPPPTAPEAGKKVELVITLHGHGGTAQGLLGYMAPIAGRRGAYCMACEGSGNETNGGHSWSTADAGGVLACVDAAIAKLPIDAKRVVVTGHSAGGAMSFATYAAKPSAFVGIYTTAAPASPGSQHAGARVVVNLGTKDPNFQDFAPSVQACEKTVVGRVVAVQDLGHDLPHERYSEEAVAWILDSKAPSEVLRVPGSPDDPVAAPEGTPSAKAKAGAFHHVLVFEAGGRGAPADAPKRADAKAKAAALQARAVAAAKAAGAAGDAGFAAVSGESQDPLAAESHGAITGAVLARYGGALVKGMSKLGPGDVSEPVESDAGWHVVIRDR
jgi:poly(3-hydroxybutyrate) depolymerase